MDRRQNGQPAGSSNDQWNSNQNQNQNQNQYQNQNQGSSNQWDTAQRDSNQGNTNQGSSDQNQNQNQNQNSDQNSNQNTSQNNNQGTSTTQGSNGQGDPNQSTQGNNNQYPSSTSTNGNQNGDQNGNQNGNNQFGSPTAQPSATQTIILLVQTQSAGQNGNQGSNNGIFQGGIATASPMPTGQSNNQQQNGNGNNDNNGGYDSNRGNDNNGNNQNGNNQNDNNNNNDNHRNQNQQDDNGGGGISDGTVKGIAIGASVGGALILAILFYIFWRRRRGASFSQIAGFKSRSASTVLSPQAGNDHLATLPIYRNDRFSVRSSRHDSVRNEEGQAARGGPAPTRSPLAPEAWKSSHPPKFGSPEALQAFQNSASSPQQSNLPQPQQAHMSPHNRANPPTMNLPVMRESNANNPGLGLLLRRSTDLSGASDSEWPLKSGDSPEEPQNPERWSWSNSNAPPTPRILPPNARMSLQSNQGKNLAAWLRSQGARESPPPDQEPSGGNKPLLKNQATQPVLSPDVPASKTSKKNAKKYSLAGVIKKSNSIKAPSSAQKIIDSRPSTAANTVDLNEKM